MTRSKNDMENWDLMEHITINRNELNRKEYIHKWSLELVFLVVD